MRKSNLWQRLTENLRVVSGVLAVIALAALLAIGIVDAIRSIPILHEGTVVDKTYQAAYTVVVLLSIPDGNGNNLVCPQTNQYPNKWTVQVVGMTVEDERRTEWWEVGESLFDQIAIGDDVYRDTKNGIVTVERKGVLVNAASGD